MILAGFMIGLLVGMTGVGGASLLMPLMIFIGINPITAIGTDFVYNSITKLFGVIQHMRQRTVDLRLALYLTIGSVPSALFAFFLLNRIDSSRIADMAIKTGMGVVLILVSSATILYTILSNRLKPNKWQAKSLEEKRNVTIGIGAILGFIVGFTSIGSGSLFALAMLYFYRMSATTLVGTDIAHAFVLVAVSGGLHAGFGNVEYVLVGKLLAGSIPGVIIGSKLSAKIPSTALRMIISIVILISGMMLIV